MILGIHIAIVCVTFIIILSADHYGLTWMTGKNPILDEKKLRRLHAYTWIALIALIISGGTMFWEDRDSLLSSSAFLLKMAFVGTLIVNSISIGIFMKVAIKRKFSELSLKEKIPLFIAGGISTLCWLGALTSAFFIE